MTATGDASPNSLCLAASELPPPLAISWPRTRRTTFVLPSTGPELLSTEKSAQKEGIGLHRAPPESDEHRVPVQGEEEGSGDGRWWCTPSNVNAKTVTSGSPPPRSPWSVTKSRATWMLRGPGSGMGAREVPSGRASRGTEQDCTWGFLLSSPCPLFVQYQVC